MFQGINLADQDTAARELESLSKMFVKFNEEVSSFSSLEPLVFYSLHCQEITA